MANVLVLLALIASLLSAQEKSGGEPLFKGATIWGTNVITFGLLFWEFDRGGPYAGASQTRGHATFSSHRTKTQHSPNRAGTLD